ncbi:MAG: hypothetical protein LBD61_03795 [Endomicrobium sp.]|jgi:CRISPR-associated endonuclease Csn1|nr:hypothetical protein [Endomicrobium sp.]
MLIEFLPQASKDKTIYSSHLLRIALLQGVKLEGWQIYKAIRSAMQRRGYDAHLPWAQSLDERENVDASNRYGEKLKEFFANNQKYYYPCYYEAFTQGIWDPENPKILTTRLGKNPNPARNRGNKPPEDKCFPSRQHVEEELRVLLTKAAELFPKLKGKEDFVIYGPAKEAYASYNNKKYAKYRGTNWDLQGLLGQKVPRFDNRIIAKCCLIARYNVCKADKQVNKEVSFLLALKNMRYSKNHITSMQLNPQQVNDIFKRYTEYLEIEKSKDGNSEQKDKTLKKRKGKDNPLTRTFWKNYVNDLGGQVNPGQQEISKPKDTGRSRFCKPALNILHSLILFGKNPHDYYKELTEQNKNINPNKGLVKEDYKFLLNMPNDWYSISIQDTREDDKKLSRHEAESKIVEYISKISNRVVRHRLLMLFKILKELDKKFKKEYGTPDKVIFEIAREDFVCENNKKERADTVAELKALGLSINDKNILKMRLGNQQKWKDIYDTSSNRGLTKDIEQYEIDHIVPQSKGGSDSFSNFVLTRNRFNQAKGDLAPYEWFQKLRKDEWQTYVKNVAGMFKGKKDKKKVELLISDKASESEKRKTDLNATSYIEKSAQKIAGLYFGFGINTLGDRKKIFFYTGGETANVRKKLNLDKLLYSNEEKFIKAKLSGLKDKNRENKKHHALDALVLSVLPEIKTKVKSIEQKPDYFYEGFCKKHLNNVISKTIKQKTPQLRETIYALRYRIEDGKKHYYFISHFNSSIDTFKSIESARGATDKDKIFDLKIQNDFKKKLEEKGLSQESWEKWLDKYTDNGKRIKKIAIIDSKCFDEKEVFNSDGTLREVIGKYGSNGVSGQWIRAENFYQGQIVYKEKDKWKVEPIYVFESMYNKRKLYENKYDNVKFFKSRQLVKLERSYEDIPDGIYELKTLRSNDSHCKLENIDNQKEIIKNINYLIENCGMRTYEK